MFVAVKVHDNVIVDNPTVAPAFNDAVARFIDAVIDNDEPVDGQQSFGVLWSDDRSTSPLRGGETTLPVDLHLARPVKYEVVSGPKGSAIDSESGVVTWETPKEPRTERLTIRARDVEKPALTAEASFTIATRSGKKSAAAFCSPHGLTRGLKW